MIESYSFGRITIDDKTYKSDIIILPGRIQSSWWRKTGHRLCLEDLSGVDFRDVEAFIIGTGAMGLMKVDREVRDFIAGKHIELLIEKTNEAVRAYNAISAKKKTAAALHLTC